ncbi:hypothetical protein M413DRAFT_445960 [Hebeloma cylindrosporum]|uniref:NACHT domain-containing protein n=1 Tax=Hebeloma cylindrosporum TaxID=76867 RepID=A0A0C3CA80_HEBCY|nr:hypothetical protein M413DRAFT_445960 [Hebeloma cylindrosporum h7]
MSFFHNARNVDINGGKFFAVNGDINNFSVGSGLQALGQAISHGAMHDSSERDPPPRCYPGTRKKVADDIIHWLEDPCSPTSVLWVNGRAGVGKSALMQTIAELLRDNNLHLGGCFFFQRNVSKCDRKGYLFSTLAFQLAINVMGMREYINQAMEDNPALPMKSAAIQLQQLIIEPFIRLPTPRPSPVIIIDGLDECDGYEAQHDILSLISQASTIPEITIRFIIASRPEYQITHMFNKEPLLKIARRLVLDEDYESLSDITIYLRDGFTRIRERNGTNLCQDPWPTEPQLENLAWRASGQFIYAATALKFVGSDFCDPVEHLNSILHPGPMQAAAFSELDRLYTQILSVYPDSLFLKSVLGVITLFQGELMCAIPGTYPSFVADILGTGESKVHMVLRALQSLTVVEGAATAPGVVQLFQDISFSHKSFSDFLTDEARSRQYFIDLDVFQGQVLRRAFDLVIESIRSPLKPTTGVQPSTWRQLEVIFRPDDDSDDHISFSNAIRWLRPSSRKALSHSFKELRSTLSDVVLQVQDVPSPHVFPALHFACNALDVLRIDPCIPEVHETMNKLFTDTRDFLDLCYRQALSARAALDPNPLIGHLALDFSRVSVLPYKSALITTSRPVMKICKTWNISDPLSVQNFLLENSHFISSEFYLPNLERYTGPKDVAYSACQHLQRFVIDPSRAQHLYQHFWTLRVRKCQEAILKVIQCINLPVQEEEFVHEDYRLALGIREFFEQNCGISSSSVGILDLDGIRDVAACMALQNFLEFLSKVPWVEVFLATEASTMITLVIASWVCHCLDSSAGILSGPIWDAIKLVYQAILTNGILPKFRQQAILIENHLNNDKATSLLILDWISALQKIAVCVFNGVVEQPHPQLLDLDGPRMHLLFKDLAHQLLARNLNSSFGTASLEQFLFQRLRRLLLPAAGFPMRYWGIVYTFMLPRPPEEDGLCSGLTWDALFFLCFDLPHA